MCTSINYSNFQFFFKCRCCWYGISLGIKSDDGYFGIFRIMLLWNISGKEWFIYDHSTTKTKNVNPTVTHYNFHQFQMPNLWTTLVNHISQIDSSTFSITCSSKNIFEKHSFIYDYLAQKRETCALNRYLFWLLPSFKCYFR